MFRLRSPYDIQKSIEEGTGRTALSPDNLSLNLMTDRSIIVIGSSSSNCLLRLLLRLAVVSIDVSENKIVIRREQETSEALKPF
ncbi:unnamed protein product [Caenorhabditis nigoni]